MSAVAFDSLEYAHQLESAGMPRAQAEVVAKGLTSMFIHNFEALVTKDYLDTRFAESEAKMDTRFVQLEAKMDGRFAKMDTRFVQLEAKMDTRFVELEANFDSRFTRLEVITGVILVAVAIPLLQSFWGLLS
jgi:alpha-acetolactate decarboxylase